MLKAPPHPTVKHLGEIKVENPMKDEPAHDESMHDDSMPSDVTVMVPKSICPDMDFKVGDEMVLRVKAVKGDMLEMEYAPEPEDESHEMPSDSDAMSMPLDKLEKRLPQSDRSY